MRNSVHSTNRQQNDQHPIIYKQELSMLNTLNDSYYYLPLSPLSAVITISKVFVYIRI